MKKLPTKNEILQEMQLHNSDEVGINNQWTFNDAEYHLLLSDKYYYSSDNILENIAKRIKKIWKQFVIWIKIPSGIVDRNVTKLY